MSLLSALNRERYGPITLAVTAFIIYLFVYFEFNLSLTTCFTDKNWNFYPLELVLEQYGLVLLILLWAYL